MKILIKNAFIVTCDGRIIKNGYIVITEDIITEVSDGEPPKDVPYDRIMDAGRMMVMPGLVNSHTHTSMTLFRNYGGGLGLEDWLHKKIFPAEKKLRDMDIYHGTMLAAVEMIKSGTTAFADMYLDADQMAMAVIDSGLRANICQLPIDPLGTGSSPVRGFYAKWGDGRYPRIKPYVLVHSAYLYGEDQLMLSAETAKELGIGIHTHLLETRSEYLEGIKKYGIDNAMEMEKCGIFDVPVIAAHCVHVTDEDISILKRYNVNVAHNPTSNLKLGSGVAPVHQMMEAGINVCLGTDGTASNNTLDMFEEIKLAAMLQKGINRDARLMTSEQVLQMATLNGAKALGFDYDLGAIRKGAKADIIMIDIDKPHFTPLNDPMEALVYCAHGSDVDTVIADGMILMEKRQLLSLDEEKILREIDSIAKRVIS